MLPEDVKSVKVIKYPVSGYWLMDTDSKDFNAWKIHVSNKPIELQGSVSNLTDEQKEGIVGRYGLDTSVYPDFIKPNSGWFTQIDKSFASLLTSLNVLLVNPYGENEPKPIIYYENHGQNFGSERIEDWQGVIDWQTAQQNVGQWILLTCNK